MPIRFTFDPQKFRAALQFLAGMQLPEFDKYRACKLLFLADKRHLVRYGRPIVGGEYRALPHGPAPCDALNMMNSAASGAIEIAGIRFDSNFRYPRIVLVGNVEDDLLSKSDRDALSETAQEFGRKSFAELRALTHSLPEYEKAWSGRPEGSNAGVMCFEDFFEEDPEALPGVLEALQEDLALLESLEARRA